MAETTVNEQLQPFDGDRIYEQDQLVEYAENALEQLAEVFLGNNTGDLLDHLSIELRSEERRGTNIPTATFDNCTRKLSIIIEPDSVLEYAEEISDEINHGIGQADVARMLVGTGVARTIIGWKTTGAGLHDEETVNRYKELICMKDYLWEEVATFDDKYETNLRRAVERLGDAQIMRVNYWRFAIGASLRLTSDVPNLQEVFVLHMQEELRDIENKRSTELAMNAGWLETDSAFAIYDDNTPEIELAFSFPMSPAEEQRFLDY